VGALKGAGKAVVASIFLWGGGRGLSNAYLKEKVSGRGRRRSKREGGNGEEETHKRQILPMNAAGSLAGGF